MTNSAGDSVDDSSDTDSRRPNEPDEPNLPGEDNPGERLITKFDPTVEGGERSGAEIVHADVPEDLTRLFWFLVAVFNVAIFTLAFGAMLIVFRGQWVLGGQITLAGAVLFVYGYYRYRTRPEDWGSDGDATEGDTTGGDAIDDDFTDECGPDDGNY